MSNFQAFEAAAEMLQPTYTHAALHVIAELRATRWCNLYASFIYGHETDLLSVPAFHEHAIYDSSVLCIRARMTRPEANSLRYLSPLGWEHINLTGDYQWRPHKLTPGKFRPLRTPNNP